MKFGLLGFTFVILGASASALAGEASVEWPYYRTAMQIEAQRAFLNMPVEIPWARALNQKIKYKVKTGDLTDVERLGPLLDLSALRLLTRFDGPPSVGARGEEPTLRIALDTCRKTWDVVEPNMLGVHTAISTWPERPTCLLQAFGTADAVPDGPEQVAELSLRMVGGRQGARGRVMGWPREKEKGFRALYQVAGPQMTLVSAEVQVPAGWASLMRRKDGSVLLELPLANPSNGPAREIRALLVFAKPKKNGKRWLDIGRVSTPERPPEVPVFRLEPRVETEAIDVETCRIPNGFERFVRGSDVRWVSDTGLFTCIAGRLQPVVSDKLPFVWVQDGGAGTPATQRVAQLVAYSLAAWSNTLAQEIAVGERLQGRSSQDHITIYYHEDVDQPLTEILQQNFRLAFPWQAVVTQKVNEMPSRVLVTVGW